MTEDVMWGLSAVENVSLINTMRTCQLLGSTVKNDQMVCVIRNSGNMKPQPAEPAVIENACILCLFLLICLKCKQTALLLFSLTSQTGCSASAVAVFNELTLRANWSEWGKWWEEEKAKRRYCNTFIISVVQNTQIYPFWIFETVWKLIFQSIGTPVLAAFFAHLYNIPISQDVVLKLEIQV